MLRTLCLATTVLLCPWMTAFADPGTDLSGNAALKYWQAFSTLPRFSDEENRIIGDCLICPLDDAARKILTDSEYSLIMLHHGVALNHCDWGVSFEEDGVYTLLPHAGAARTLSSLACLRARERLEAGQNPEGAIDDLLAAIVLGRHTSVDGSLIGLLVGYSIEHRATETLAVAIPKLDSRRIKDIQTRFDALPPFRTEASALLACEKVTLEWFVRKVRETKDKQALLKFLSWVGISEEKDRDVGGKAAAFLDECGGTSEGVVKFALEALPSYDAMARILDRPLDAFENEFKRESIKQAGNPVYKVFFPALEKSHQSTLRADVRRALFTAALAVQLDGQDALKSQVDPFGGGRFDYVPYKAGFELRSKMNGQDNKPVSIIVGQRVGDNMSNNLIVDLGWSEIVEGLKARLSVEAKEVVEGATKLSVHLELQNASETRETKELHLDLQNVKFAVVDGEGKAVSQPQVIDYGGRVAGPWTVRLAPGGSQRVDMTSWGLSIRPNLAAVLDLGPTFAWEFTPEQSGPYYLQARLEIAKDSKQPESWSGSIVLPKSTLPLPFKRTR